MVGLPAPPGEERERNPNRTIQDGFDRTAVSAVAAPADDNQRVALADERPDVLQRILPSAKTGIFQPALKAAAAGSILIVCMNSNRILIRFFGEKAVPSLRSWMITFIKISFLKKLHPFFGTILNKSVCLDYIACSIKRQSVFN